MMIAYPIASNQPSHEVQTCDGALATCFYVSNSFTALYVRPVHFNILDNAAKYLVAK